MPLTLALAARSIAPLPTVRLTPALKSSSVFSVADEEALPIADCAATATAVPKTSELDAFASSLLQATSATIESERTRTTERIAITVFFIFISPCYFFTIYRRFSTTLL